MDIPDPDDLRRRAPMPPADHIPDWREQREIRRVERRKIQKENPGVGELFVEMNANRILEMWLPELEKQSYNGRSVTFPAGFTPSGPENLWTEIDVLEYITDRFIAAGYGTQWAERTPSDPKPGLTYAQLTVSW